MRIKLLLTILLHICFNKIAHTQGVFVSNGNNYVVQNLSSEANSINKIAKELGYNTEEVYSYTNYKSTNRNIFAVLFRNLSESVICVITKEGLSSLSSTDVSNYLEGFIFEKEYTAYKVESTLNKGVTNRTLSSNYFAESYPNNNITANSTIALPQLGYELTFTNGVLSSYRTSDGQNKWAKDMKLYNISLYRNYENEATKYWGGNKAKIINEINVQADAWARTDNALSNQYADFHRTNEGTVNFKMLLVAHYKEPIKLKEFKEINYGRYHIVDEYTEGTYKRTAYKVNSAYFIFDENGNLESSYSNK